MNVILLAFMLLFLQGENGKDFIIGCFLAITPVLSMMAIYQLPSLTLSKLEKKRDILRTKAEIKELEAKINGEQEDTE